MYAHFVTEEVKVDLLFNRGIVPTHQPEGIESSIVHRLLASFCRLAFEALFFNFHVTIGFSINDNKLRKQTKDFELRSATDLDMTRSSAPFHVGLGSDLRNFSTVLKSENSTKTDA